MVRLCFFYYHFLEWMKTKFLHERNFILEFLPTFEESYSFYNNFLKSIFSIEKFVSFIFWPFLPNTQSQLSYKWKHDVGDTSFLTCLSCRSVLLITTHQCCVMQSRTRSGNLRKVWPVYPGNLTAWHWCFGVQSGRDIAWPCAVFLATFLYRRQREKTFQFYIYIKVIYIKRQTPRYIQRGPLFVW